MEYPIISDDPAVQEHYEACRRSGTSHTLSEMFALAMPPMSDSDREFNEGRCNGNQWEGSAYSRYTGDRYKRIAERAGVSVTGKTYLPGLAAFPGDPKAWVSDKADVARVITERGWNCNGAVNIETPLTGEPRKEVDVAESIVQERVAKELAVNPEQKVADVREKVKNKARPHWKKKQA